MLEAGSSHECQVKQAMNFKNMKGSQQVMQVIIPLLSYLLLYHCMCHLKLMKSVAKQKPKWTK